MPRLLSAVTLLVFAHAAGAAPPDFDRQIAPILASHCTDCHGGAKPKGKLDLTRSAGAAGVLVAGKPADSPLWQRIAAGEMPPKKPLPEAEQKLLKEWIESGAKWGADPIDPFRFSTSTRAGYDWWSLQPVKRPAPPKGAANPIDAFVIAKLSGKGLSLSPEADRRTLIRRVYFDLIGLPPTPEEVAAFVTDKDAGAYEKVVDKLLASPHYGERWARHWLDVVRYGETDGFERNTPRSNSWHYRDWVIRALNSDIPFDRFAQLQLAGDVLKPDDPDAVRATGFLVAGVHNTVLGNDQMRAIARQDELEDIVGSVAQTFLGLTANCARCHDHKFDPIAQADFYRLAAALGGVGFGERPLPDTKLNAEVAKLAKQLGTATKDLAAIEEPARKAVLADKGGGKLAALAPSPVAAWDFRKSGDDLVGKLHAKVGGTAKLAPDGAVCDGKTGFLRTPPLPFDLKTKTLEAWVRLDGLTQRGGGVISIQTPDGAEFDAIVFGENEPARWMAGSNGFVRYKSFGGTDEKDAANEFVHFAITYSDDGTITGYRNGKAYGKGYASKGPVTFARDKAVIVFGCRHEPVGGNKMLAGTVSIARVYDKALSAEQVEASFAAGGFITDAELDAKLDDTQRTARRAAIVLRDRLTKQLDDLRDRATGTKAFANVAQVPGITRVLARGDLANPGAVVSPAGVASVPGPRANFGLAPFAPDSERRKKLAEWITAPANPLFARVIVNRVWHYHFGTGIVETPNDFGFNGGRPSHPELLDWLASEFAERKYSLKALHKLIVTSATYRQSSGPRKDALTKDADNRLLWRYKPHRLEGEAVRDTMLAVSGLLNPEVGGKGFSDYKVSDFNGTAYFEPFDPVGPEFHRRSVYRFTPRGANQGLLDTFDCPDPAAAAPRRAITTTPLQALALWNNGFALRTADAFAARVSKDADTVEKQVRRAWQLAYQRDPTPDEAKLAAKLVADHGLKALCRVLFNSNEFVTVEWAMHPNRREFFSWSGSGLGAMAALHFLAREAGAKPHHAPKAKRAIQISLVGGMSHIDSFDYKPELAKRHGQPLGGNAKPDLFFGQVGLLRKPDWEFKQGGQSGLWMSDLFARIGNMRDEITLVKSMTAESANHTPALFVLNSGFQFNGYPALGSWLSYGLGSEADDLPAFVVLPDGRGDANGAASNWSSGFLPAQHQGVVFRGGDSPVRDLFPEKPIPANEEKDSRAVLDKLNALHLERAGGESDLAARINSYSLAAKMQLAVPAVADLSKEPAKLKTLYGFDDAKTADCGRRCLLARRLLERGVRFVQIYSGGPIAGSPRTSWDAHENVKENHGAEAARIDAPVAALLQDLKQRGMLKDTLVIFTTEFGRTPFTQSAGNVVGTGRDHNKYAFTCWLAGAGLKPGFAYGETDDIGWKVAENPVAWHDFHATVLHLLGIDHEKLTYYHNGIQRRLTNVHGEVVKGILA